MNPYPELDGSLVHISSLEIPAFCDRLSVSHSALKFFTFFSFFLVCVALLVGLVAKELKEYFEIWRLHDGLGLFLPL